MTFLLHKISAVDVKIEPTIKKKVVGIIFELVFYIVFYNLIFQIFDCKFGHLWQNMQFDISKNEFHNNYFLFTPTKKLINHHKMRYTIQFMIQYFFFALLENTPINFMKHSFVHIRVLSF